MRTLFGLSHEALLLGLAVSATVVVAVLGVAVWRNPLLLRLAWRNVPRRPGFAALITLGLTIGTVILSSAFTTGDTMSQSVRGVVAGVLGSADEVVFIPASQQRTGFDLAQSIASGSLLTGVTSYFPSADTQQIVDAVANDKRVAAVVPVILEQAPASSDAQAFVARINLLGVPAQASRTLQSATHSNTLSVNDLEADEAYVNTEAATALGVSSGQRIHIYGFPHGAEAEYVVKDVTRPGDLGGGQATIFLPLARLQELEQRQGQVNQVLVINSGDAAERLANSWPVTVTLRSAFVDDATARRFFRAMSSSNARELLARVLASPDTSARLADKLRRLQVDLDLPDPVQSPEFRALVGDPELVARLAGRLGGTVVRGNTPFSASVAGYGSFRVIDVQSIAQDQADRWGSVFTDVFVVLGAFSLFSGMLLIVLVFSLVALERRPELGISRALGARRRDVIMLLAIEGGLYSLISSAFGLGGGLALALAIIGLAQRLIEQYGFHLQPVVEPTSIAASYGLGVVLTFIAVCSTAWRSSRFSIVTAIRDAPDPPPGLPGWRDLVWSSLPAIAGPLLIALAMTRRLSLAYAAGSGLTIVGGALLARWVLLRFGLRGPERVVFTLAGFALIGWWMLPVSLFPPPVAGEMSFLSGLTMLLGAVWVLAYNVGLLRRVRQWGLLPLILSPSNGERSPRGWPSGALWHLSTAYVAANRFRTGLTLAMFSLVVLSLTISAVMLTVTATAYADPEALTGGWDIHAQSSLPPRDLGADLASSGVLSDSAFSAIGAASPLAIEAIQTDTSGVARWAPASVLVVDDAFLRGTRAPLVSGRAAWADLSTPGMAIVGAGLLSPGSANRLRVIDGEGNAFRPIKLWLRDTRGTARRAVGVQVIGLADARGPFANSVLVGHRTLAEWPPSERGGYYFSVPPGASSRDLAAGLAFAAPDLTARTIGEELRLVQGVRGLLNMILQGFMGVGLLAGIAALGTLSTRAVVERRRQIGVLRAVGFTARAISAGLLVESAIIALLGAGLGVGAGLFVAQNTVSFLRRMNPELRFSIPWDHLALMVVLALVAALVMTLLPARQAARLTPAEALREA